MERKRAISLIRPESALKVVLKHARPLPQCLKPLDGALGYCLAEDVRADRDIPPADRSAMDGYAVRSSDLKREGACVLRLKGEVAAGSAARPRVTAGSCVRILTGGNVPPGADTVVMVEETEEKDGLVTVRTSAKAGENIRKRGEDSPRGAILLRKGVLLGPHQISVCAAVGKPKVRVHRRPRVAVLCTGEELRGVGERVRAHEIRNSNGPALCAALAQWGYGDVAQRIVPDDPKRLAARLRQAVARHDVVLLTGGVSVGTYDFVRETVEQLRARIRFHGVAMRPGKPLLYATLPRNRHIFGLPGNPISAMFTFNEFALPALRRLSGVPAADCRPSLSLPLAGRISAKPGRAKFVPGRILWEKDGPRAVPVEFQGSADLVAAGAADGLIAVPFGVTEVAAGEMIQFRPWRPLP